MSSSNNAVSANPFDSPAAMQHSNYTAPGDRDRPTRLESPSEVVDLFTASVDGAFRAFVTNPQFSCVGAKSAVHHGSYRLAVYEKMADRDVTAGLSRDLFTFAAATKASDQSSVDGDATVADDFRTFVAVFKQPASGLDEAAFERLLWAQLQMLHGQDAPLHDWDPAVSHDPDDPHFSFSFAGTAFFIVGLHPASSRLARQFPWPALVFNPHAQFERLKDKGQWERMQQVIRAKETQLQGDVNPVLRDFGADSEAKQYSGRNVEPDWTPPFKSDPGGTAAEPKAIATKPHAPGDVSRCPFHRATAFLKRS